MEEWSACTKCTNLAWCPVSERYECLDCGLSYAEDEI